MRYLRRLVLVALVAGSVPAIASTALGAPPPPTHQVSSLKDKALHLEQEITADESRISSLSESYDEDVIAYQEAQARIATLAKELVVTTKHVRTARRAL